MYYLFPLHRRGLTRMSPAPGVLADERFDADSRYVETVTGIGCGLACGQGAILDNGAVLGAPGTTRFIGISMMQPDGFPYRSTMAVLTRGEIWVRTGGVVRLGNSVSFNRTTGVFSAVPPDDDNAGVAGARWMASAHAGHLASIRLSSI